MNFKTPSYAILAAVSYAIFAVFGLATWYTLLFVAVPPKNTAMDTLQALLSLEPGAPFLRFHAGATVVAAAFAIFLWLRPLAPGRASFLTMVTAALFAVIAWAVFRSDSAILPTMAAVALAMSYMQTRSRPVR